MKTIVERSVGTPLFQARLKLFICYPLQQCESEIRNINKIITFSRQNSSDSQEQKSKIETLSQYLSQEIVQRPI